MSKKDCIKKAEELLKGEPAAGEVLAASYYYTAAEAPELAKECFIIYAELLKKSRALRHIISHLFGGVHSFSVFHELLFTKDSQITDKLLLDRNFIKIHYQLREHYNDSPVAIHYEKEYLKAHLDYIKKGVFNIIKARKLLFK